MSTIHIPHPGTEPQPERLTDVAEALPGGRWLTPHATDGPFHLVVPDCAAGDTLDANWSIEACMAAYPPLYTVPMRSLWDDGEILHRPVFAVPDLVSDVLFFHVEENGFTMLEEMCSEPYDTMPGDAQVIEHLAGWLGHHDHEGLTGAIEAAARRAGLPAVITVINALDATVLLDADALAIVVAGILATP